MVHHYCSVLGGFFNLIMFLCEKKKNDNILLNMSETVPEFARTLAFACIYTQDSLDQMRLPNADMYWMTSRV